jgi:Tfp pilus assembly protein PilF
MGGLSQWLEAGRQYQQAGDFQRAEQAFRQALEADPAQAEAWHRLGQVCQRLGKAADALASYREALRLEPDRAATHNSLGILMVQRRDLAAAVASFRRAVEIRPDFAKAHNNLGNALKEQGDLEAAVACYRKAVRLGPEFIDGHNNLGLVLADLGQFEGALACYARALELQPDYREARRNRALVWLLLGDYERGWPEYEWRWGCPELPERNLGRPAWDGSPLQGRTILLHAEQGLGDTIQFVRYAPLVKARGGRVLLVCQPPLLRLLALCPGVDRLAAQGDPLPPFDVHAPLLGLPRIFGATTHNIPADVPYLRANPELVERWRQRLASIPGLKVGIAWQGNPKYRRDWHRSVDLERFAPLARVAGVALVSLQKGLGSEQLRTAPFPVVELEGLDEQSGPFMDTAAVMKDTAISHLAGALAVPCWVALPVSPDWRWLLDREDSPWYPTVRLFRAARAADWGPVFERMAGELPASRQSAVASRQTAVGCRLAKAVSVEIAPGELIDKITILQIKAKRITAPDKLRNVRAELAALTAARDRCLPTSPELSALTAELRAINEALWVTEDDIRQCERSQNFGPPFVELARSVYGQNDRRAALKRRINELLGSAFHEEKQYTRSGA